MKNKIESGDTVRILRKDITWEKKLCRTGKVKSVDGFYYMVRAKGEHHDMELYGNEIELYRKDKKAGKRFDPNADVDWHVDTSNPSDPSLLPDDVAAKLMRMHDALLVEDVDLAYHLLYSIASPSFCNIKPWKVLFEKAKKVGWKSKNPQMEKYLV